jgi:hypothetical protein
VNPRYERLRYDELTSNPAAATRRVLELLGETDRGVPLAAGQTLAGGPNHTVAGNPMRFRRGEIEIKADERWRREMPDASRALVTALTWPTLLRHGFVGARRG